MRRQQTQGRMWQLIVFRTGKKGLLPASLRLDSTAAKTISSSIHSFALRGVGEDGSQKLSLINSLRMSEFMLKNNE